MLNHLFRCAVVAGVALLCFLPEPAYAQLRGAISVGVSVVRFEPASDGLKTKVRVVPTVSRVPRKGWGLVGGLNWYEADVDGDFVGIDRQLGKVTVRPFMGGFGYTAMMGRLSVTPSLIGGPAWNQLEIDDDLTDAFGVRSGDDDFEGKASKITFAVRPGISATLAVAPRFGLTAFAGYLFNRPKFDVSIPTGQTETPWKADGLSVSAGIVIPIFKR